MADQPTSPSPTLSGDLEAADLAARRGAEPDPWTAWRQFTNARIALGRSGHALPTAPWLAFNLAHAQARDAVHHPLELDAVRQGLAALECPVVEVQSAAGDRAHYLRRPDLGRRLDDDSRARLSALATQPAPQLVFVIADGLSATAAGKQAVPMLEAVLPRLSDWTLGPLVIATQARVALGDEIGALLGARFVVVLIGERPGLSSPDSLGLYITRDPQIGRRDAERNCISNVRPEGLNFAAAAHKLAHLLQQARRLGLTGVGLKDDSEPMLAAAPAQKALDAARDPASAGASISSTSDR